MTRTTTGFLVAAAAVTLTLPPMVRADWTQRAGDLLNTGQAESSITAENARDLRFEYLIPTFGDLAFDGNNNVNHTPVVTEDLLFFGDWAGKFYVVDLAASNAAEEAKYLLAFDTGSGGGDGGTLGTYTGVQATPFVAEVGGEKRVYFGINKLHENLWCLDVGKIQAARSTLVSNPTTCLRADPTDPGSEIDLSACEPYFCEGPWPADLAAPAAPVDSGTQANPNPVLNGSAKFVPDQSIDTDGDGEADATKDIIFTPSTGLDCSNGEFYAMDAETGEKYWTFDPVKNGDGMGGVIWTLPALNQEKDTVFLATGDCVQKPQAGEMAESLVALDAATGEIRWWHQRRLVDVADMDIGNYPTIADVDLNGDGDYEDAGECRVVVSTDKDGCIYGFHQEPDIPQVGEIGFDPLRPGQQRVLWRRCFVPGSLNGGFNASGAVFHERWAFAQASLLSDGVRIPGDEANAFAVEACNGKFAWASSSVGRGRSEGAITNGLYIQSTLARDELQIVRADGGSDDVPTLVATVELPGSGSQGGGGIAVQGDTILVPIHGSDGGVAVVRVGPPLGCEDEDGNAVTCSEPVQHGNDVFKGPYPAPVAPAVPAQLPPVDPNDPYPLY